jgi:hypothetical protein
MVTPISQKSPQVLLAVVGTSTLEPMDRGILTPAVIAPAKLLITVP